MSRKSPLLLRASNFYISKVGAAEDSYLNPFTKANTHGGKSNGVRPVSNVVLLPC